MYGEMEMEMETDKRVAPAPSGPSSPDLELANRIMFFVPGEDKALVIYDQSPEGPEAKFAGSLPEGKFHASGMVVEERDPDKIEEEYSVVRYVDGSCMQRAIAVNEETFLRIAMQGIYPQYAEGEHRSGYMVIDMYDNSRPVRSESIQSIVDEQSGLLNTNQKTILEAAIDVSGETMRKVVLGENNKSFQ
ncbi:MAG: hypothetical protein E7162_02245 [Firmicutes bacterium]|nr:hypothetical protein [Bacillota bacterium]